MAYLKILGQWAFEFLALYVLKRARNGEGSTKRKPKRISVPKMNGSL